MYLLLIYSFIILTLCCVFYILIIWDKRPKKGKKNQSGGDINFANNTFKFDMNDKHKEQYSPRRFNKDDWHSQSNRTKKMAEINPPISYSQDNYYELHSNYLSKSYNADNELLDFLQPKSSREFYAIHK